MVDERTGVRGDRADLASVRRSNLSLVLRMLGAQGPSSRSALAAGSGLNRATVATLVSDLETRGLVASAAGPERGGVGRPGQVVRLDGVGVHGVGVQVDTEGLHLLAVNLAGSVVIDRRVAVDSVSEAPELVLGEVARAVAATVATLGGPQCVVGLTVAVPALVDARAGRVDLAPNLGWRDVEVVTTLEQLLAMPAYPVLVDNDANLAATAEHAVGSEAGTGDLVVVTGAVGVGGGVLVDGRLVRGASGFAGELGHMPLDPAGQLCGCSRFGCWETMVGLGALMRAAAGSDDGLHDPSLDHAQRLLELRRRAMAGDHRTLRALREVGVALGIGIALLVNVFDPAAVVLGGYFAAMGDQLLEPVHDELSRRVLSRTLRCRVALSVLGTSAAARGGAQVALDAVFDDPTLVPLSGRRPDAVPQASGGTA
jgi:predicted NBD/HSP70 family sugar kinase